MNNKTIPEGLELVTDKRIIRLFPTPLPDYSAKPEYDPIAAEEEFQAKLNSGFFDSESKSEKPLKKCKWGRQKLERFLYKYTRIYKDRRDPNRDFFLEQLESVAKENNVILPTEEEMTAVPSRKDSIRRFTYGLVDLNTENKVSDYNYYFEGSFVVAYLKGENKAKERELHERTKWDDLFKMLYPIVKEKYEEKNKLKSEKEIIRNKIESELTRQFYEVYDYNDLTEKETCPEFIGRKLYNKSAAYSERKKRFRRKKDQTQWTAWWTITYDDRKFSSEKAFKKTLLNKFRNLCVRKQWKIMGVFENGEENGRLHFHGFFYIPKGSEVGELVKMKHYSEKKGCWHEYIENTEFKKIFGTNEYEDITESLQSEINSMSEYTQKMLRYMEKGGTVYYSRHIPMEFSGKFNSHDMLMYYNITCKRKIKRYIVNPNILSRTETSIVRKIPIEVEQACDIGLLDEEERSAA